MKKNNWILFGFIIIKFILQYVLVTPVYDLQRDEYLHLDQGNHLAWGYISLPPVTSWLSFAINLLGGSVTLVRFVPALFGALTILLVWKIVEGLKGNLFALILGSLSVLVSAILRVNILYQPNSLDVFFWCLFYFTFLKYINTSNSKWLYAMALAIAFGILSKYNILFLSIGFLPAILLSEHRKVFGNKHFYISIGITLIIILPNIIWQWRNNFPTINQLHELQSTQLVNVRRIDFVKDQFLYFISSFFVIIAAFVSLLFYSPFKKYRIFLWSYIFTLSLFIYLKGKSYYAIGLYPVLIAFGAVYLEALLAKGWRIYLRQLTILLVLVLSAPIFLVGFPTKTPAQIYANNKIYKDLGLLRWEDGKDHAIPQDFADMLGWHELADKVEKAYDSIPDKVHTLILCDNYGQAGAINYYAKDKSIKAVSFNADYINWFDLKKQYANLIRVKESDGALDEMKVSAPFFDTAFISGSITDSLAREYGTTVFVFIKAKVDINKRIQKEIEAHKHKLE